MSRDVKIDLGGIWESVQARLQEKGIDVDFGSFADICCGEDTGSKVKVVCVSPHLKKSVEKMGETHRNQVVMVRIDEATMKDLDSWVATGAVKSRSEAAALFIREGLKVRADELEQLRDALGKVEEAQERLRSRAKEIFGEGSTDAPE